MANRITTDYEINMKKAVAEGVNRRTELMHSQWKVREWLIREMGYNAETTLRIEELIRLAIIENYNVDVTSSVHLASAQLEFLLETAIEKKDYKLALQIRTVMNKLFGLDAPQKVEQKIEGGGFTIEYVTPSQRKLTDGDEDSI